MVAEDLRRRGVHRASVLGHSMGGKIAMALALEYPEMVADVVIADIAARRYPPRHTEIFGGMAAVAGSHPGSRAAADRIMEEFIPERSVRAFLLKSYVPDEKGLFRWKMNVSTLRDRYADVSDWPFDAGVFDGPALLIRADRSPYVGDEDIEPTRRHFPALEVVTMTGVGHWLHAEKPEEFCDVVFRFLS